MQPEIIKFLIIHENENNSIKILKGLKYIFY